MKLQRLELFGFKSFADKVAIEFNPGVTAIVGPNGCGKSNISDAIRWVLGEQRPTLIRGSKMEEVIFNGSRERKPINLAEVTLRFSNEDALLPVEYSEVAVTRRVYREGESEYLLNRQTCRLKDIQDLFMGTGIGTHAYTLIAQGMVDSVLSDKTEERRYLFEEAAGVTRYKSRRRAAERKLEATTHDLERVEDIVSEVEKSVTSLKRQVGKTRRFRNYQAEETRLDVHATSRELAALAAREAPLVEELRGLEEAEAAEAARIAELEAAVERLELELVERREADRGVREEAEDLRRQVGRREESQLVTGETLKHDAERLEALAREDERADERAEELAGRRVGLVEDRREAAERLERIEARLEPDGGSDEERHHAELKAERAALGVEIEDLQERLAEARQTLARQASAADAAEERVEALAAALAERTAERAEAEAAADRARAALEVGSAARDEAARATAAARDALRAAEARLEELREGLAAERAAEQAAVGRLETLSAMEARFEGYARGARALLAEGEADGLHGALPQAVEPAESRYERPLERYLETLGHGIVARDRAAASAAADRLAAADAGRADLVVADLVANGAEPEIPDSAAAVVIARGSEAMRWTGEAGLGERLAPLFARLLVVADREAALRCRDALARSAAAARHYVIAALDGTLIEPTGRWRTAGADDDEGLLARRRRIGEAEAEAAARREAVARLAEETAEAERGVEAARARLAAVEAAAAEAEEGHRAAREALALAESGAAEAARRVAEIEEQAAGQETARERARAAAGSLAEREAEIASDLERAKDRAGAVRAALERHEQARMDRQSARHAVELERAEADAALRAVEREIDHVDQALEALETARADRAAERARLEEADARLEAERAATAEEIARLYERLDGLDGRLRESGERLRDIEERRASHEADLRRLHREHDETRERRHEVVLARQDLEHRRRALGEHLAEHYEDDLETLAERHPLEESEAELPLEEIRGRLEEVRRKRANLGPVNMLAVEEFEEESQRLEFLAGQRDDLVQAKRQLEEAIRKINQTARELFEETFALVAERFDETFRTLFEGGHAEIRLAEPDDPLESPIDIVASPRGKRVQNIGLLSGGARALAALSLLFAIYQVKPSPFCVLDEVDAPLDDANVGRFLHMIRHFSDRTQFVVITHNKRTMEAADFLYGVTMEEPGVSTLVSVALDQSGAKAAGNGDGDGNGNGNGNGDGNGNGQGNGHAADARSLDEVWASAVR